MTFGNRLKTIRKNAKLSQNELAQKLYVTNKTISSWEADRTEPNIDMITKISEILESDIKYLLNGEKSKIDIETEIKIKITEKEYKYQVDTLNSSAQFINEANHIDNYYAKNNTINNHDGWIIIGTRGNKKIITYKKRKKNTYDEYEVEIDNVKTMGKIINVLGYKKVTTVEKNRKKYIYQNNYEISLDKVKKLGYFIEIEIINPSNKPIQDKEKIIAIAKKLHLKEENIINKKYPELLKDIEN